MRNVIGIQHRSNGTIGNNFTHTVVHFIFSADEISLPDTFRK